MAKIKRLILLLLSVAFVIFAACDVLPQSDSSLLSGAEADLSHYEKSTGESSNGQASSLLEESLEAIRGLYGFISELGGNNEEAAFEWINSLEDEAIFSLASLLRESRRRVSAYDFRSATGFSYNAANSVIEGKSYEVINNNSTSVSFGFAGDCLFDDDYSQLMINYLSSGRDITAIIDPEIIKTMKSMDIMIANNEFCISDRGKAINKAYTFRASPGNTSMYHELGIDLVTLANNHVFDYGTDAFLDTLENLDKYGIKRIGAGKNFDEASAPMVYIAGGWKIAVISATRAEKNVITPEATEETAGTFWAYESEKLLSKVSELKKTSDFVIVIPHTGYEETTDIEPAQRQLAYDCIDAGADLVVCHHAHVLQGFEFYGGKLIAYNLGNFIFNTRVRPTAILELTLDEKCTPSYKMHPFMQKNMKVSLCDENDYAYVLSHMRNISFGADISETFVITDR